MGNISKARILIIDDEQSFAGLLKSFLQATPEEKKRYEIEIANNLDDAINQIDRFLPELIITDLRLDKGLEGLAVFDYLKENNLDIPTVIVTAFGNRENLIKCISKRPYYLAEKSRGFEELKQKVSEIVAEVKSTSRGKPHLGTLKNLLGNLPESQHFQLILDQIENFSLQQYQELEEELPLLRLSIQDENRKKKKLDIADQERIAQGLVPLSLLDRGTVHCEKKSYKSKATGERKVYTYFYLRWIKDDGRHAGRLLGKLREIKDPLVLEKIYLKYPELKAERLNKY